MVIAHAMVWNVNKTLNTLKTNKMNTKTIISKDKAQEICNNWHGGQWSALYSFASTKFFYGEKSVSYLWEIMQCLQNEYFAPCPHTLSNKETKELNQLKAFFEYKIKESTFVEIEYKKHPVYGYLYPDAITGFESFVNFEPVHIQN